MSEGRRFEAARRLACVPGVVVRMEEPMARHLPHRVGGPVELWVLVPRPDDLGPVLAALRKERVPWRVHWPFEEWLVRDGGLYGAVIRPGRGFEGIAPVDEGLRVGAATPWAALTAYSGFEALARWPGTVGGTLARDRAALRGLVRQVRWWKGRRVEAVPVCGEVPELPGTAVPIDVIVVPRGRVRPRPAPGVLFEGQSGDRATELDRAGLGEARLRAWRLAPGGAMVNLGGGTCADLLALAQGVGDRVERLRGARLRLHPPILGAQVLGQPPLANRSRR